MTYCTDVHLLVIEGFADWEPAFATAHIAHPAPGFSSKYRVRTVSLGGKPVVSQGGLRVVPDLALEDLSPTQSAMLILPGGDQWTEPSTDAILAFVQKFVDANVPVAAICGATFGLARAGFLDDRRHTSNEPHWLASSGYRGAAHYVEEPAVEDRGIITAPGTAPIEFARLILAKLEVFPEAALEAWYALYTTKNPASFFAFIEALGRGATE